MKHQGKCTEHKIRVGKYRASTFGRSIGRIRIFIGVNVGNGGTVKHDSENEKQDCQRAIRKDNSGYQLV